MISAGSAIGAVAWGARSRCAPWKRGCVGFGFIVGGWWTVAVMAMTLVVGFCAFGLMFGLGSGLSQDGYTTAMVRFWFGQRGGGTPFSLSPSHTPGMTPRRDDTTWRRRKYGPYRRGGIDGRDGPVFLGLWVGLSGMLVMYWLEGNGWWYREGSLWYRTATGWKTGRAGNG